MVVLENRDLSFFQDLIHELQTVRAQIQFCDQLVGLGEKVKSLIVKALPAIFTPYIFLQRLHHISYMKVSLGWWAEQCQYDVIPNRPEYMLFGSLLKIPEELQSLKIWCYAKELYSAPIELLAWWMVASQLQLTTAEWTADTEYITLAIRVRGRFKVRWIEAEDDHLDFWVLNIESESVHLPAESLSAALLIIQLAAQQGGGALTLCELDEQQMEIQLSIPRAETSSVLPSGWLNFDSKRKQMTDQILTLIALSFKDVCQRLRFALSEEELPRLEPLVAEGKIQKGYDLGISFLRKMVSKLDAIMQTLDDWLRENQATLGWH
ncbi:MAG: hypothetical protein NUW24_17240 [Anaerolineae bacterium]|jgi:hypothetical protein|nr:hypothetical protein [Anaerolineae bacterium]